LVVELAWKIWREETRMLSHASTTRPRTVTVRPLAETDLDRADQIFRLAFGTFVGLPDPLTFMGDADLVRPRWRMNPWSAFAAWAGDTFAGSNFATNWGSVGFFGPLTVRPDLWDAGIGKRLMEPVLERFTEWGTRHAGLFTFPHSQKHIGLYQRFGFFPRFLTAVMAKPVTPAAAPTASCARLSDLATETHQEILASCRDLTDTVYDGLDVTSEIRTVASQRLGDTVLLLRSGGKLNGFAVCHCGPGSEAGSGACYVKFGVVRPGPGAPDDFDALLSACEALAADCGASRVVVGVNTARHEAYGRLAQHGFRTDILGVVMQRPNEPGYNRAGVYLIDDWR
jgi:GNAT superfamily N-acetyltransferase